MAVGGAFPGRRTISELTAKMLLEVDAVVFNAEKPFIFTSGWASPVYIDCRRLISFPRLRQTIIDFGASVILREAGFEAFDAVAGGETAGIPFAAWMADRLMLPMQYVRKQPKGFGRDAQIEGHLEEGQRILLVEDLTTAGRSKINFCEALRTAGAEVNHVFVVFHYGIFPDEEIFRGMKVSMHSLANWFDVLDAAKNGSFFDSKTLDEVEKYLNDPVSWSRDHGGVSELPGN